MLHVLLAVLVSWQRYLEQDHCLQQGCFVKQAVWLLVRVYGFVPLVVDGFSEMLVHGTGLSSKRLVMVR